MLLQNFIDAIDNIVNRHKEQLKFSDVSHKQLFDRLRGVYFTAVEVFGNSHELDSITNYIFEVQTFGEE